jgi:hypothetical protein
MADSSLPDFWDARDRERVMPWDASGIGPEFARSTSGLPPRTHVLVPGCGSAYEVSYLAEHDLDVLAIDFSSEALELARRNLACVADRLQLADFSALDCGEQPFDVIHERAFLCALPRKTWQRYAQRAAAPLKPGDFWPGSSSTPAIRRAHPSAPVRRSCMRCSTGASS